jgi:4-amino-4-deoxy-L-arabinose transferase-like glycosyltransferase
MAQAWRLAEGGPFDDPANLGMPAADHPPMTALLLTPAALVRDQTVLLGRVTMALIGTATIVVLAVLARRLAGDAAGVATAALAAVNPNLWVNDALPMSEAPAALVVAGVLLALHRLLDRPTWGRAVSLGALCGLAVLTRGELALLVPVTIAPAVLLRAGPPMGRRLATVAVVAVVGVAVVAPWTAWNLTRFEQPVLLSTNEGLTLVGANCAAVYEGGGMGFWNLGCARDLEPTMPPGADQSVRSERYRQEGLRYVADNLDRLPAVVAVRIGRMWGTYHPDQMVWLNQGEGRERWASWAGLVTLWVLLPLAVVGGVALRRRRVPVWPLASTAVIATVTAAAFYGIARFRLPFDVAETVLAGVGIAVVVAGRRGRVEERDG